MKPWAPADFITSKGELFGEVFPKGKTKGTRLCGPHGLWKEHSIVLPRERAFQKISGKIHILKAFDYPEFEMRCCSAARIQIHPHEYGFCGKRHVTLREGLSRRLTHRATGRHPSTSPSGDSPPSTCRIPACLAEYLAGGGYKQFQAQFVLDFIPCSLSYVLLNISRRLSKCKHPEVYRGHTIK